MRLTLLASQTALLMGVDDDDLVTISAHAIPQWVSLGLGPCGRRTNVTAMVSKKGEGKEVEESVGRGKRFLCIHL